jgi:CRP-like cAMP-binding protein/rhodanese-related sulfurtransferase
VTEEDRVDILRKSPVFKELPGEVLEAIARVVGPRIVPGHSIIFREGDPGDSLYIIKSGSVRIFRENEAGINMDISIKRPGETFGEMALLTGEPRTADVEATEETHLMALSKDHFDRLMRDYPDIHKVFIKEMRSWLLRDEKRLETQAQEAVRSMRMSWIDFPLILAVSLILAIIFNYSNPNGIAFFPQFPDRSSFPTISPSVLRQEASRGETLILDASPANFYKKRHIKGAVNVPLAIFDIVYLMTFNKETKEKKIVIYGGTVSKFYDLELAEKLRLRGQEHIWILKGGLAAWERMGYPVEGKAKE